MVTLLVTIAATAASVMVARREWPVDSDGSYVPLQHVAPHRLVTLLEFPAACLGIGLLLSAPVVLNHSDTPIVSVLAAMSLAGLIVLQALHAPPESAATNPPALRS